MIRKPKDIRLVTFTSTNVCTVPRSSDNVPNPATKFRDKYLVGTPWYHSNTPNEMIPKLMLKNRAQLDTENRRWMNGSIKFFTIDKQIIPLKEMGKVSRRYPLIQTIMASNEGSVMGQSFFVLSSHIRADLQMSWNTIDVQLIMTFWHW